MSIVANDVHQGDCIKKMKKLDGESIDLVFADPPFNIGYTYDVYDDQKSADEYLTWSRKWIKAVYKSLKADGTFWLAIGDEFAAELKLIAQEQGFHTRSWVIWYYTFGVNLRTGFSRSHTHLFHFVKDASKFTFNKDNPAIRIPSARQLVYADNRANPKGRLPDNTWVLRPQDIPDSFSANENTWYYPRVAGTFKEREGFHGCQMPEQLLGRIVRASSNPGELVLDPFSGSGTTLAVAKKLGRRWLGFEMSKEYVRHIKQRLKSAVIGDPLDGPENPLKSAPKTAAGNVRNVLGKGRSSNRDKVKKDQEKLKAIVTRSYQKTGKGLSTDHLLADPGLNQAFVKACKKAGAGGVPQIWNETLIGMRKQGKLPAPKQKAKPPRLAASRMDTFQFAAEIALHIGEIEFGLNVDKLLCNPETAAKFDELAAQFAPGHTPFEYRWSAISFRKSAKTTKTLGKKLSDSVADEQLPKVVPLSQIQLEPLDRVSGVYSIVGENGVELYVGSSLDLAKQIRLLLEVPAWQELNLDGVRVWEAGEADRNGLKSAWASRLKPQLNSRMIFLEETTA